MGRSSRVVTLVVVLVVAAACGGGGATASGPAGAPTSAAGGQELAALQVTAKVGGIDYPIAIIDTGDAVWVLSHSSATWSRIDPATNAITDTVHTGGAYAGGGVLAGGKLWNLDHTDRTVVAVDPATRKVAATIDVGLDGGWLVGGADAVYAVGNDAHEAQRIDAATQAVTQLKIKGTCGSTPAVGGGFLWMVSLQGHLCKLDPTTGAVLAELDGVGATKNLAWAAGRLLVPTEDGGVTVIDPASLTIEATVPAPPIGSFQGARYALGTPGDDIAVMTDGSGAWIRFTGATAGRLDLDGDPALTVYAGLPTGNDASAMASAYGSLWFGDVDGTSVVRTAIP